MVPTALPLNFTGSFGMALVKLWLIASTMLLKMVSCQSHKTRYYIVISGGNNHTVSSSIWN